MKVFIVWDVKCKNPIVYGGFVQLTPRIIWVKLAILSFDIASENQPCVNGATTPTLLFSFHETVRKMVESCIPIFHFFLFNFLFFPFISFFSLG